jgi:hypothetical protein
MNFGLSGITECVKAIWRVADGIANAEQRTEIFQALNDLQMANTTLFEKYDVLRDKYDNEKERANSLQKVLDATIDWKKEREKYKLINLFPKMRRSIYDELIPENQCPTYALTLKIPPKDEVNELLCPTCFENKKKSYLSIDEYDVKCPVCGFLNRK